jgi:hypothetical protein
MPVEWVAYAAFALAAVAVLVGVAWAASGHDDGLAPAPPDVAPDAAAERPPGATAGTPLGSAPVPGPDEARS